MSGKQLSFVLFIFALLCATQIALIVSQIDKARVQLSNSSPGGLNFLLQTDSIFDEFRHTLSTYVQSSVNADPTPQQTEQYKKQFEMVWSALNVFSLKNPGKNTPLPQLAPLLKDANDFLEKTDPLISSNTPLTIEAAQSIYENTRQISERVHAVGHQYFILSSQQRDELNHRMDTLYRGFWFFGFLLFATAAISTYTLIRANRRSRFLVEESNKTHARLSEVVTELRSGKLERKAKDSFLAAASHDLRQPLHALGLFLGSLEKHVLPAGRPTMQKAQQSASVLTNLFSSLLDLSRLDAGVVKVFKKDFALQPLLQTLEQAFSSTAAEHNIRLVFDSVDATIRTDRVLLDRMLRNLIENAIIHSNGNELKISTRTENSNLLVDIEDDGKGIPNQEHHAIFSEYYQIGNPERDRSKGLGLGLSIVNRLSELLHTSLKIQSNVNQGCKFTLTIPLGRIESITPPTPAANNPLSQDAIDAVIAVIDDERDIREGMEIMLGDQGYATITADSDTELIAILNESDILPDLLITDYRLRENHRGDEAIFNVRKATNKTIPAIIITGDTSPKRVLEASKSGFRLMHKPAAPADLLDAIKQLLLARQRVSD